MQRLGRILPSGLGGGKGREWPFVAGRYRVLNASGSIVVASVAGEQLNDDLAALAPPGVCMIAPLRSAGDLERLVRNVLSNLSIQTVLVAGAADKHRHLGEALIALAGKARGDIGDAAAAAAKSLRAKLDDSALEAFAKQVDTVNLLGCEEVDKLLGRANELGASAKRPNTGFVAPRTEIDETGIQRVLVAEDAGYEWERDKAGAFRITLNGGKIVVEHLNTKDERLRFIEGTSARDLCLTLIRNGWVSKLDHAAYLGHELMRAQAALEHDEPFEQDGRAGPADAS